MNIRHLAMALILSALAGCHGVGQRRTEPPCPPPVQVVPAPPPGPAPVPSDRPPLAIPSAQDKTPNR